MTLLVTPWIDDEHCSYRALATPLPAQKGDTEQNIASRVAFIEKSPRVRVAAMTSGFPEAASNWKYGPKGSAPEYGRYQPSRDWCDNQLRLLGYTLPEDGDDSFPHHI